ncbi:hypothetical protein RugamoR57_27310 [Duganella caerulea]|uniref:hypothetical protein n=1 Tax=Duganella caerulea TaxID=2885762 RepID=UPI0030E7ED78
MMIMKTENRNEKSITLQFSIDEILIVNNALNEVCNALGPHDFETRMGATIDEARALLKSVGELLDKYSSA